MDKITRAAELRLHDKVTAIHTRARGVVTDRALVYIPTDGDEAEPLRTARVKFVGPYGVREKNLHPEVLIERR